MTRLALFNVADFKKGSGSPGLGLPYIASYLRNNTDFNDIHILIENVLNKISDLKPDIIGISSVSQNYTKATQYAKIIKETFDIPVIIGGIHITLMPQSLSEYSDLAVIGEGEETMAELMAVFKKDRQFKKEKLAEIKGIAYRDNGRIKVNPRREFIKNLDTIPFPARDLLGQKYFLSMMTSRGCPFSCSYCSSIALWQRKTRYFSPEYIVDEISELIERYNAIKINFWDDTFIINKKRVRRIVELIKRRGIHKKVEFRCAARADEIDDEICSLLKEMNIIEISMGLESGSTRILKEFKGGKASPEKNMQAIETCKKYGFSTGGSFMLGFPTETEQDMLQTYQLIKNSKLDAVSAYIVLPLPGTQLWKYALDKNLVSENMDFGQLKQLDLKVRDFKDYIRYEGPLLTDKISREKFLDIALLIKKEANKRHVRGFFNSNAFSIEAIRFALQRPGDAFRAVMDMLRSLLSILFLDSQ